MKLVNMTCNILKDQSIATPFTGRYQTASMTGNYIGDTGRNIGTIVSGETVSGKIISGEIVSGEIVSGEIVSGEIVSGGIVSGEIVSGSINNNTGRQSSNSSGEVNKAVGISGSNTGHICNHTEWGTTRGPIHGNNDRPSGNLTSVKEWTTCPSSDTAIIDYVQTSHRTTKTSLSAWTYSCDNSEISNRTEGGAAAGTTGGQSGSEGEISNRTEGGAAAGSTGHQSGREGEISNRTEGGAAAGSTGHQSGSEGEISNRTEGGAAAGSTGHQSGSEGEISNRTECGAAAGTTGDQSDSEGEISNRTEGGAAAGTTGGQSDSDGVISNRTEGGAAAGTTGDQSDSDGVISRNCRHTSHCAAHRLVIHGHSDGCVSHGLVIHSSGDCASHRPVTRSTGSTASHGSVTCSSGSHGHHGPVTCSSGSCGSHGPVSSRSGSHGRHGPVTHSSGSHGCHKPVTSSYGNHASHRPFTHSSGSHGHHGPVTSNIGSRASHILVTSATGDCASCGWVTSLVLFLLLHILAAPVAGRDLTPQDITDIERFTEHVRQCHGVTAVSLSVVQGDRTVMTRGFGHSDLAKGTQATADTPFCIGSLTKAFTSTLLAMQIAENKNGVDWDTPLHCFPHSDFSFSDDIRSSQTSLRDLLSHRLGVPGYFGVLQVGYPASTTRSQIVQRIRFMQPTRPFRSGMLYNNFLYGLAGYAAELLADRAATWEELTRAAIFNPAGMMSSGFIDRTPEPAGLALPYVYVNGTTYQVDTAITKTVGPLGPAGSIYSTAADMVRWMQLHLAVLSQTADGSTRSAAIPFPGTLSLDPAAVKRVWETYQPQIPEPPFAQSLTRPLFPVGDVEQSYAMAWIRGIYRGYRKLFHTGGISTYISLVQLLPDMDAGIFLSTSGPGGKAGGIVNRLVAYYIMDKITGLPHWFNDTTACSFPAPWAVAVAEDDDGGEEAGGEGGGEEEPLPTLAPPLSTHTQHTLNPLSAFPGQYGHHAFGTVRVYAQAAGLYARYGSFGHFQLEPTSVVGFYLGKFLDKLWYLSNQDGQRSVFKFQFTDIDDGRAQHLLLPIDPSQVATFTRGLDANSLPAPTRRYPGLYTCPPALSSSADTLSLHSLSRVGATFLATLGAFTILRC